MSLPSRLLLTCLTGLAAALVLDACGGRRSLADLQAQELFLLGQKEYEKKHFFKAIELFQTLVYNYPGNPIVDSAQYYLGLSYFGNEDYELAGLEFNRLAANYPSSVYFEHAVFMRAVSHYESTSDHYGLDQSELVESIRQFGDFIIDFPESELLPDARTYLLRARTRMARKYYESGVVYTHMRALAAAKTYFQKVIDDYTDTEYAAKAAYEYAEAEYRLGNYAEAHRRFRDFTVVFVDHEWMERAATRAIRCAFRGAEQAYRNGDYAQARQRLEEFQQEYPDNGYTEKADEYLKEIREVLRQDAQEHGADS